MQTMAEVENGPTYKRWISNGRIFYSETTPPGVTIQISEGDGILASQSYHLELTIAQDEHNKGTHTSKEQKEEVIFQKSAKKAIEIYKTKVIQEAREGRAGKNA